MPQARSAPWERMPFKAMPMDSGLRGTDGGFPDCRSKAYPTQSWSHVNPTLRKPALAALVELGVAKTLALA